MTKGNKIPLIKEITGKDRFNLSELPLKKKFFDHGLKRISNSHNTARIEQLYKDLHEKNANYIA